MEKPQLNTDKITSELKRLGRNKKWLASRLKNPKGKPVTPALVSYIFKYKPITYAYKIAQVFGMDAKDLIR